MTVFIEAIHIGRALRSSRRSLYWNENEVAPLLGVSESVYRQYECGGATLSTRQLQQIFTMGLMMMRARQLQYEYCCTHARKRKNTES